MTGQSWQKPPWTVIDLFSGAGGMSCGFARHGKFQIIAAVDAELGKPSAGNGSLHCNSTYAKNLKTEPFAEDLSTLMPEKLEYLIRSRNPKGSALLESNGLAVLLSCAPCTGFSRTKTTNHLKDDPRNQLVPRSALFAEFFSPDVFIMENARELVMGRFRHHYHSLRDRLERLGYRVSGQVHFLNEFGLPQKRERALVVAVKEGLVLREMRDLWSGCGIKESSVTVRRAIGDFPPLEAGQTDSRDPMHTCPANNKRTLARLHAIPSDGGSWSDLIGHSDADLLLNPAMKRYVAAGDLGSHPDVYGRMHWDRPAVTIKRECAHVGNGRYSHPEQHRMLSVREMAVLQGFPRDYRFCSKSLSNMYRHIGDAVPPLVSFQLAHLVEFMFTGQAPRHEDLILPHTHLDTEDLKINSAEESHLKLLEVAG